MCVYTYICVYVYIYVYYLYTHIYTINDERKIFWFNLESKDSYRGTSKGRGSSAENCPARQGPRFLLTGGRPHL